MKKTLFPIPLFVFSFSLITICSAQTKTKAKSANTAESNNAALAPAPYNGPKGCPAAMTDDEFKTAKKTVSDETDMDEVLDVAKKVAVAHCFSALQVKALMNYLRSDENRFEFFKTIYVHIYDQNNYSIIGETFKDASYKDKIRVYVNSLE